MILTDFEGYHGILSDFKGVYWDFKAYQVYQLYQEVQVILWKIMQNNYTRYIGHFKGSQGINLEEFQGILRNFNGFQLNLRNVKGLREISTEFQGISMESIRF